MWRGAVWYAALLLASPTYAQEMRPLADIAREVAEPYPPARCAGLYLGLMEWAGRDRMGEDVWAAMDASRETMILVSALIAQNIAGGAIEPHVENTVRDVRNVANLYLSRMEQNYAVGGQALGNDTLIMDDMTFCKSLVEAMQ